jgi:hypothetical protein
MNRNEPPADRDAASERELRPSLKPSKGIAVSNWLIDRCSRFLSERTTRRGFLISSAMVGSATVIATRQYALQPVSAYTAITSCPSGSLCADGYSEFCCVINSGVNACPSGTFAGGWWRADYSSFCNGTRYYIDCMQTCCSKKHHGSGFCQSCVACQCATDCNSRRVYCNYFRYGQCHQEIKLSGPIACRVVSCVPPYVSDPACTSTGAVDNATAEQTAPCL